MKLGADFCRECGCNFPPKYGEGRCRDWWRCWVRWTVRAVRAPALGLLTAFVLGAALTLTVVVVNVHELYAWHWKTFVYKGDRP